MEKAILTEPSRAQESEAVHANEVRGKEGMLPLGANQSTSVIKDAH